jgi:hypothetical protein
MQHPLEFVSTSYRKRSFLIFLFLTMTLFAIFRVLDKPLHTSSAPNGIVSFELAGSVSQARVITDEWKQSSMLVSDVAGQPNPEIVNVPYVFAAFGLGVDYLFMPVYAFALAFGTLFVTNKHTGWLRSLGAVAGYGAFAAALFDAVENYALFQILLNRIVSPYPEIAYYCASIKFGLLIFGLMYALTGFIPTKK